MRDVLIGCYNLLMNFNYLGGFRFFEVVIKFIVQKVWGKP